MASNKVTGMPTFIKFIAIPPPIVPAPRTDAVFIFFVGVSRGTSGIFVQARSAKNRFINPLAWSDLRQSWKSSRSRSTPLSNGSSTAALAHSIIL